ncbi:MAG: hypothetical protein IJ368_02605 [Oscillospiraceae bacterium]|nr:hypothetical protein [Oscillospiraceae bacterium]
MEQRAQRSRQTSPRPAPALVTLISSVVLGVSIIIAGGSITGSVKKLTAAVEAQTFASTLNSPSNITITNTAPKNYYTEQEAAAYLNLTVDEIKAAITKGEIKEYIKTSAGYSISQTVLDDFFEQRAYDTLNSANAESAEG